MVLQCYLESTLQVGTIQEILGNGIEAETLLSWGKTIALHQCLPLYVICFSILLGKLYHKKVLWELAEKELQFASQILNENWEIISCLKCRMFLEISISQQLGDLFKDRSCASTRDPSMEMLSLAGEMYLSALHRLQLSEWKNSLSSSEEAMTNQADRSYVFKCKMDQSNSEGIPNEIEKPNVKAKPKRCRKIKKEIAPSTNGLRMTPSRSRAFENNAGTISGSAETCSTINSKSGHMYSETYAVKQRGNACESNSSLVDCVCEVTLLDLEEIRKQMLEILSERRISNSRVIVDEKPPRLMIENSGRSIDHTLNAAAPREELLTTAGAVALGKKKSHTVAVAKKNAKGVPRTTTTAAAAKKNAKAAMEKQKTPKQVTLGKRKKSDTGEVQ